MDTSNPVEHAYDVVADEYARRIFHELDGKPFDRDLLDRFAARVGGTGPVYDLGCGPGHVGRYLQKRGVDVTGIDLSAAMVEQARELNRDMEFRQGDMRHLDLPDGSAAALIAFYSIIHFDVEALFPVFEEWRRVLRRGALLLLAFHVGDDVVHMDEWWGRAVDIDFRFFAPLAVTSQLARAAFRVTEVLEREPYTEVEHPSRRAYVLAEAP